MRCVFNKDIFNQRFYRPFRRLMDSNFMLMSIVSNFHKVETLFELI